MRVVYNYFIAFSLILGGGMIPSGAARAQSVPGDSSSGAPRKGRAPVYKVNYWVSGGIILGGAFAGYVLPSAKKSNIDSATLANLNPNDVPSFDRISLHQNPALVPRFDVYSNAMVGIMAALPLTLLFDGALRHDWVDLLVMGLEVNMVTVSIYAITPLGPLFQTRYRPVIYYPDAPVNRKDGNQKNSFYSGHVESAAASSFFMAKVYCDYHPELGSDKWWVYGAAAVPPLLMGYFRFMSLNHFPSDIVVGLGVGTLCGVLIPELHRIGGKDVSMGVYSSPSGTGLTVQWTPPVMASQLQ